MHIPSLAAKVLYVLLHFTRLHFPLSHHVGEYSLFSHSLSALLMSSTSNASKTRDFEQKTSFKKENPRTPPIYMKKKTHLHALPTPTIDPFEDQDNPSATKTSNTLLEKPSLAMAKQYPRRSLLNHSIDSGWRYCNKSAPSWFSSKGSSFSTPFAWGASSS